MKKNKTIYWIAACFISLITIFPFQKIYSQTSNSKEKTTMDTQHTNGTSATSQQVFIDKFFVPKNAKHEFDERMKINRNFIKNLPGFIEDNAYVRTDEHEDFIIVTVAIWENENAIRNAKQAVQELYQKEGFDMPGMLKRLNIVIDRAIYKRLED